MEAELILIAFGAAAVLGVIYGLIAMFDKHQWNKRQEKQAEQAAPLVEEKQAKPVEPRVPFRPTWAIVAIAAVLAGVAGGFAARALAPSTAPLEQRVRDLEGRVADLRFYVDRLLTR